MEGGRITRDILVVKEKQREEEGRRQEDGKRRKIIDKLLETKEEKMER